VDAHRIAVRRLPPVEVVALGAEIAPVNGAAPRPELAAMLAPGRPPAFLTVGTIEPRKNIDFALDLFDALAARGLDFQWHFVGAHGWSSEKTARRIQNHPEFGHRLQWWTDLADAELEWCYERAAALVAVSRGEGFGLPLLEARLRGLPVFASDIAVFREVLGGEGRYLPLGSAALAAAALEDFLQGVPPAAGRGEPSRMARSWEESARELLAKLESLSASRRS
jgi:glycosyltransferase involved in cell wall biosynthesis